MFENINTQIDEVELVKGADGYWTIKGTRADFTYQPKVKQLVDTMYIPVESKQTRDLLIKIISKKIEEYENNQ